MRDIGRRVLLASDLLRIKVSECLPVLGLRKLIACGLCCCDVRVRTGDLLKQAKASGIVIGPLLSKLPSNRRITVRHRTTELGDSRVTRLLGEVGRHAGNDAWGGTRRSITAESAKRVSDDLILSAAEEWGK